MIISKHDKNETSVFIRFHRNTYKFQSNDNDSGYMIKNSSTRDLGRHIINI